MLYFYLYCNIKYYLCSSKSYLKPCQFSMMELFFSRAITYFRKKAQLHMLERVLNTPQQLHLFHALYLKKGKGKLDQYQSVQFFLSKYPYVKHTYPCFPTNLLKNKPISNKFTYQKRL